MFPTQSFFSAHNAAYWTDPGLSESQNVQVAHASASRGMEASVSAIAGSSSDHHHDERRNDGHGSDEIPAEQQSSIRRLRRRDLPWEKYKAELKKLYLEDNKKLEDIIEFMKRKDFHATPKQYKERFNVWGWKKTLPQDTAQWMVTKANKRKREEGKDTVFVYGETRWTKQRAERTVKRGKSVATEPDVIDMETPGAVSYKTPAKTPATHDVTPGGSPRATRDPVSDVVEISSSSDQSDNESEPGEQSISLTWRGFTRQDLNTQFKAAQETKAKGNAAEAEQLFSQASRGFRHLLGPVHEDVSRAIFALATLYADQGRMIEAYRVLEKSGESHFKHCGIHHKRTQQHIREIVEHLNSWERQIDALAFLDSTKELANRQDVSENTQRRSSSRSGKSAQKGSIELASSIVGGGGPDGIDYGLAVARTHVLTKDETVEKLLLAIIAQCGSDTDTLALQRTRAWSELLQICEKLRTAGEKAEYFVHAYQAFLEIMAAFSWDDRKFASIDLIESCIQLASNFLSCGHADLAHSMFEMLEDRAKGLYGHQEERTVSMLISIGLAYQKVQGWNNARRWFESALATASQLWKDDDGIVRTLEVAIEKKHFSYSNDEGRPYKTVFGVTGIYIRPSRVHLG